jgi:hypothetical protein
MVSQRSFCITFSLSLPERLSLPSFQVDSPREYSNLSFGLWPPALYKIGSQRKFKRQTRSSSHLFILSASCRIQWQLLIIFNATPPNPIIGPSFVDTCTRQSCHVLPLGQCGTGIVLGWMPLMIVFCDHSKPKLETPSLITNLHVTHNELEDGTWATTIQNLNHQNLCPRMIFSQGDYGIGRTTHERICGIMNDIDRNGWNI